MIHRRPSARLRLLAALLPLSATAPTATLAAQAVTFEAADGSAVHATWYRATGVRAGVIVAFHQGGASGEAEYAPIAPRLNRAGFDVLAVDQRAGGNMFGGTNRTVEARGAESDGFCEAAPDLAAALAHARETAGELPIVLWGSSYSGALALRLAATRPAGVQAVLAFSPASGGPMAACRGEDVSDKIAVPALVLRPASEMEREASVSQFTTLTAQGHRTYVADPGTHGSSMLVASRVEGSVEPTWAVVLDFLRAVRAR